MVALGGGLEKQGKKSGRESLGSRAGFILISAGCAIGLGNVWRFPVVAGMYGGAIFVVFYLVFLFALAAPIMVMEFAVGRASRESVSGMFAALRPKSAGWSLYGPIALAGNYILMMFYTVVSGWMLAYFKYYAAGEMSALETPEEAGAVFGALTSSPWSMIGWMTLVTALGSAVCGGGLRNSVERVTKVMMSGMLIIMAALAVRSVTLPGADAGLEFYLRPDIGKLFEQGVVKVIFAALGQAFFTLSIGVGSMAIFGSYIGRERSLAGEAVIIGLIDTAVAITAGLIIFPSCMAYGVEPGAGPGLLFVSLPNMFVRMPGGQVWGALFFLFMSFASLSTVIAVFEHIIANTMDRLGWSRARASLLNFLLITPLSLPCALGFNVWAGVQPMGEGSMILDLEDFILSNNLLPLGSMVYVLFCVSRHGWGWDNFLREANAGEGLIKFPAALRPYFAWVVPAVVFAIFAAGYWDKFFR